MKLFSIKKTPHKTNNIIYNSPHSGENFPRDFFSSTLIDKHTLLCSGDSFIDELYSEAANNGSILLSNNYCRSFMDTNREPYELDPNMFSGDITIPLNSDSSKVKMGYGSIARYAHTRKDIYKQKILFSEAQKRIDEFYFPVHNMLDQLLNEEFDTYGYSLLVDCHSMPSYEFLGHPDVKHKQADIILGNLHGTSCNAAITNYIIRHFRKYDLSVSQNAPFAGGYNTQNYSDPAKNRHAIQIEIKKSLYMDEVLRKPNQYFEPLKTIISSLTDHLAKDINSLI
ncbi:MAG: N-formylglutamate amidohydrolase [Emcibacteraceae bacterium]|nr:N-formylglutamate amidohydrolase [Emcibacteraceae bacterium]